MHIWYLRKIVKQVGICKLIFLTSLYKWSRRLRHLGMNGILLARVCHGDDASLWEHMGMWIFILEWTCLALTTRSSLIAISELELSWESFHYKLNSGHGQLFKTMPLSHFTLMLPFSLLNKLHSLFHVNEKQTSSIGGLFVQPKLLTLPLFNIFAFIQTKFSIPTSELQTGVMILLNVLANFTDPMTKSTLRCNSALEDILCYRLPYNAKGF